MVGSSKWIQFSKKLVRQLAEKPSQLRHWSWHFLWINSALSLYCINPAQAAETVLLQYADRRVTVSLTELKTFVETGETTPALQEFIQRIPVDQEFERQLFSESLPIRFAPSGDSTISRNAQFILYQVNKLVGRPSGDENYPALRTALIEASQGRGLTLLRLIEAYPDEMVRVELRDLGLVYRDINLFVERIQPLVQSRQLLEDWLCECAPTDQEPTIEAVQQSTPALPTPAFTTSEIKASSRCELAQLAATLSWKWDSTPRMTSNTLTSLDSSDTVPSSTTTASTRTSTSSTTSDSSNNSVAAFADFTAVKATNLQTDLQTDLQTVAPLLLALDWLSQTPAPDIPVTSPAPETLVAASALLSAPSSNRQLVFTFGPIGRSISIDDLAHFAETGETTRQLRSYLRLVNLDPQEVQNLLNRKITVKFQLAEQLLNNVVGEYVMFQASEVIHTPSRRADILAMRSAIILSLQDDNQISPIEFLQRYPTQQMYIDGVALLKVAQFVRRTRQNVGEVTDEIGDWLVGVRSAIAADICSCGTAPAPDPVD